MSITSIGNRFRLALLAFTNPRAISPAVMFSKLQMRALRDKGTHEGEIKIGYSDGKPDEVIEFRLQYKNTSQSGSPRASTYNK